MMKYVALGICVVALLVGCSPAVTPVTSAPSTVDATQYVLSEEPEDAADVIQVRQAAQDGDDIVIVGRIGGRINPWIEGRAAFSIVDSSLKACTDIPGDTCPTPWDYCCEGNLSTGSALVKFIDNDGQLVKANAQELLGVKELSTVVVQGKAKRDEAGNLTVLANGIYVKK
jgi:hypothetical protein